MQKLTISLFSFLLISCLHKDNIDNRAKVIYEVLNASLQVDTLYPRAICQSLQEPFHRPNYIRKDLFNRDTFFLNQQLADWTIKTIDSNRLFFISPSTFLPIKAAIDKTCDLVIEYTLSYPLFSKDSSRVLMTIVEDCKEFECGNGVVMILKRAKGRWVKEKIVYSWKN